MSWRSRAASIYAAGLWLVAARALAAPGLSVTAFEGDLSQQRFVSLGGELSPVGNGARGTEWSTTLKAPGGQQRAVEFRAWSRTDGAGEHWSYSITNREPDLTVCEVTFPIVEGVCLGGSLKGNEVYWPSMYRGARVTDLVDEEGFRRQASDACKGVPYLYGAYQGDLCLPLFVQTGPGGAFGMTAMDPTSEVLTFIGTRSDTGMRYQVATHPQVRTGASWGFGEVLVSRSSHPDWHPYADRYREWLTRHGFGPRKMRGDVCTMIYGRWGELRVPEAIRWAKAYDARDVLLWVNLYGRGDQYYPCYFPEPKTGIAGMTDMLGQLRKAGLAPYFYTNGYLLSPLQQEGDAQDWQRKHPSDYPEWLAPGDHGYADTVAEFRKGYDFAGPWLQTPGELEARRVRRVSFQWGEFPAYWWHYRPFWAACVDSPDWRKLMRDTARLHAQMGACGMFLDQVGAIHPELCAAAGHGHDGESFGLWNRAYLELLKEVQQEGARDYPGFFLEAEGAADRYAQHMDKYLSNFGEPAGPPAYPQMLRYSAPWVRTDDGCIRPTTAAGSVRYVERALLLGSIFRVNGGQGEGPDDPNDPLLTGEAMKLLRAGIQTRRDLVPFMDDGRYMHTVGLQTKGCAEAAWFQGPAGVLIVARAGRNGAAVSVGPVEGLDLERAHEVDWRTGREGAVRVHRAAGRLAVTGLGEGYHLVVVPATARR
jgi:hypothetical protein